MRVFISFEKLFSLERLKSFLNHVVNLELKPAIHTME